VEALAESGDSPALVPSESTPVPAPAGVRVSAVSPTDGIDANRRKNPAAKKTLLTTRPSNRPPRKQYKRLFYMMNPCLSRPVSEAYRRRIRQSTRGVAILPPLLDLIGGTRGKIHYYPRSSEGQEVVLPALPREVGGQRKQPRS